MWKRKSFMQLTAPQLNVGKCDGFSNFLPSGDDP